MAGSVNTKIVAHRKLFFFFFKVKCIIFPTACLSQPTKKPKRHSIQPVSRNYKQTDQIHNLPYSPAISIIQKDTIITFIYNTEHNKRLNNFSIWFIGSFGEFFTLIYIKITSTVLFLFQNPSNLSCVLVTNDINRILRWQKTMPET